MTSDILTPNNDHSLNSQISKLNKNDPMTMTTARRSPSASQTGLFALVAVGMTFATFASFMFSIQRKTYLLWRGARAKFPSLHHHKSQRHVLGGLYCSLRTWSSLGANGQCCLGGKGVEFYTSWLLGNVC